MIVLNIKSLYNTPLTNTDIQENIIKKHLFLLNQITGYRVKKTVQPPLESVS